MTTKLYQATREGICAGLEISEGGYVRSAAPILGGKSLEGKLGWWVIKRLQAKGYTIKEVNDDK